MLRFLGQGTRLCDGRTRREILRVGGLGLLGAGLDLPQLARASERCRRGVVRPGEVVHRPVPDGRAAAAFDLGPEAATHPRRSAASSGRSRRRCPGLSLSDLMPLTAQQADKICVLRAVSTGDNAHSSSGYYMLTGRPHSPQNVENANPGPPNDSPSLGALVRPDRGAPEGACRPRSRSRTGSSTPTGASGRARTPASSAEAADPWLLNAQARRPKATRSRRSTSPPTSTPPGWAGGWT